MFTNVIEGKILAAFERRLGHATSKREIESWKNSMQYMNNVLVGYGIPEDAGVAIEYKIPLTSKRVDFILTGCDADGNENAVIVELKQWSEVEATGKDAVVVTVI
ncbi:MAG: AAA family ATPase, partial [Gammaproteobacteria bacterium]